MEKEDITRRFVKYMANLIHYNSINYDKKRRVSINRFPLTLDNDKRPESIVMAYYDPEAIPPDLKDHISDSALFQAYTKLTEKQQRILSLAYVQGLNDKGIATVLGVSQQNVSKIRLNSLRKLRQLLTNQEQR
ncbi:sigma-70 family RNA polymerase sigma factor [Paenibacillus campinasensis]|uniref:sigma-70 family RNA polymerase sigma factor n=1 Tax=Paenibacillus campinasensis TaxID=66347 RepID=UPI0015C7EB9D|nr:sigma-70 family RNA polymerase sigma factor [Paenibacillus campinasensis]